MSQNIEPSAQKKERKYDNIPISLRLKFIEKVYSKKVTIKEAAKELGIKFSTSKVILQTFRREGRIGKKKTRDRKSDCGNSEKLQHKTIPSDFLKESKQLLTDEQLDKEKQIILKNLQLKSKSEKVEPQNEGIKVFKSVDTVKQPLINNTNKIEQIPTINQIQIESCPTIQPTFNYSNILNPMLSQNFQTPPFFPLIPMTLPQEQARIQYFSLNQQTHYLEQEINNFRQLNQNLLGVIRQNQLENLIRDTYSYSTRDLGRSVNSLPDFSLVKPEEVLIPQFKPSFQSLIDPDLLQLNQQCLDLKMRFGNFFQNRQELP